MIKKLLLGIVMAFSVSTAFAASNTIEIDVSGMTGKEILELRSLTERAQVKESKVVDNIGPMVELASTWGTQAAVAAEGFAKAFIIAARELGVTVNEFLQTDAGKLTALLIIWKVAGASIVHGLYGILFLTVGLTIIRVIYIRLFTAEYKEVPYTRLFGMFTGTRLVRVQKSIKDLDNDGEWLVFWIIIITTIAIMGLGGLYF